VGPPNEPEKGNGPIEKQPPLAFGQGVRRESLLAINQIHLCVGVLWGAGSPGAEETARPTAPGSARAVPFPSSRCAALAGAAERREGTWAAQNGSLSPS